MGTTEVKQAFFSSKLQAFAEHSPSSDGHTLFEVEQNS
jgi:hypothetical protein